jgi:hypothetical protein
MKQVVFILLIILSCSCNNSGPASPDVSSSLNESGQQDQVDSGKSEKVLLDSLNSLGLMPLYDSCLKYMYVLYGSEEIPDGNSGKKITVGECDVRLIDYTSASGKSYLFFGLYIRDSIPVPPVVKLSRGLLPEGFEFDKKAKMLTNAIIGENAVIRIDNLRNLYNSGIKTADFNQYIATHKTKLHAKFLKILNQINL